MGGVFDQRKMSGMFGGPSDGVLFSDAARYLADRQYSDRQAQQQARADYILNDSFPAQAVKASYRGVTAPGRALKGEYGREPSRNMQAIGDVAELAGLMTLGSAAIPAERNALRAGFTMDYFGTPVRILENPKQKELAGFINRTKYKAARRIIDNETGDVYVWDAADPALHQLVAEQLGIDYSKATGDMIELD